MNPETAERAVDVMVEAFVALPPNVAAGVGGALCFAGDAPDGPLAYRGATVRFEDGAALDNPLVRIRFKRWLRLLTESSRPGWDGALLVARLEGVDDAPWPAVRAALTDGAVL